MLEIAITLNRGSSADLIEFELEWLAGVMKNVGEFLIGSPRHNWGMMLVRYVSRMDGRGQFDNN